MFGGKLGDLDAYVPLPSESAQPGGGASGLAWMKNDYRGALDRARREGKLVLVNFTGYACTNCHWMKANMFTRPEIAAAMKEFVLVELYTDAGDASRRESEGAGFQVQDHRHPVLRNPRSGRESGRHIPGLTKEPAGVSRFLEERPRLQSVLMLRLVLFLLPALSFSADTSLRGFPAKEAPQQKAWESKAREIPQPDRIREYIRRMSERPHHAGLCPARKPSPITCSSFCAVGVSKRRSRSSKRCCRLPPGASWNW